MSFYLEMEPSAFFFLEGRWGLSSDKKADGERGDETGAAEIWSNSGGIIHMKNASFEG